MMTITPRQSSIAWAREIMADPRTVFLDTETTGIGPSAEIVDLAVVDVQGRTLIDTLVSALGPIPAEATAVHGITDAMVADAPTFDDLYRYVRWLLDRRRVIIYNAEFDLRMIEQSLDPDGLAGAWLDPGVKAEALADCAMRQFAQFRGLPGRDLGDYRWHKLTDAVTHFGITIAGSHRALQDALLCRAVVAAMAEAEADATD